MKNFFKTVGTSILANLLSAAIVSFVLFLISGAIIAVIISAGGNSKEAQVTEKSFLVLDLDTSITDMPEQAGSLALPKLLESSEKHIGLWDLTSAVAAAANDPRIHGIFIKGTLLESRNGSGYASLAELRRSLHAFREKSKKPVVAWLDDPSLKNLYIASAASQLFIHPAAELDIRGLASTSPYFASALKKFGIGVQTVKVGKYKSAIEPFFADKMGDADREQKQQLYTSIWNVIVEDIAESRRLQANKLHGLAQNQGILTAAEAREAGLIDDAASLGNVIDELKTNGAPDATNQTFAQVHIRDYIQAAQTERSKNHSEKPAIAVLFANGEIVDGAGDEESVGGDTLAAQLRQLRNTPEVKALVLRVNSPGGSAYASEIIRLELERFVASGKPVVVSMGRYAASGGYWISTPAKEIFAERTTITGSIGVFGLMFDFQNAAASLGIHFDGVKTARFADLDTLARPKDADEIALLQRNTDRIYDDFVAHVAKGRNLSEERVREIAEGRVWSGVDALKIGLADNLGGLRDAVEAAARHADLAPNSYVVSQYPEARTLLDAVLELIEKSGEGPVVGLAPAGFRRHDGTKLNIPPALLLQAATALNAPIFPATPRQFHASGKTSPLSRAATQTANLAATLEKFNDRRHVYARLPWWEL